MGVEVAAADMAVEVAAAGMAVGVEAVPFTAGAVGLPRFTAGAAAGMAEAVGFMDSLPMVASPTLVMDGVAMHRALTASRLTPITDMDLLVTP
jgi:hypothetical protein